LKAKWNDFLNQLWALKLSDMKSPVYRKKAAIAKEKIEEINLL
jgi:hypothetical protein